MEYVFTKFVPSQWPDFFFEAVVFGYLAVLISGSISRSINGTISDMNSRCCQFLFRWIGLLVVFYDLVVFFVWKLCHKSCVLYHEPPRGACRRVFVTAVVSVACDECMEWSRGSGVFVFLQQQPSPDDRQDCTPLSP